MMLGLSVGLTASIKGVSASPPTVLTATFPALSDETVDITGITYSADTTHLIVTENDEIQPAPGDPRRVTAASSLVHTTALSGSVTLRLWAESPGGVSSTAASGSTDVARSPWLTSGCVGHWQSRSEWGGVVTGTTTVTQVNDIQPASSYPTGKTGPYHLTSASGIALADGILTAAGLGAALGLPSAAELCALVNGEDTPCTIIVVQAKGTAGWQSGPSFAGNGHQLRFSFDGNTGSYFVRYDGTNIIQKGATLPSADLKVVCQVYRGSTYSLYTSEGVVYENQAGGGVVNALNLSTFNWNFSASSGDELTIFNRDLTPEEIAEQIGYAATRQSLPLA